ncbi:polynucleotide adenylyltransferase PcnB [Motiliproteus sp. MSK22-1]|uniref:polynucleotide adenylyltransferase PcnB n=1 Tax=Motiliproteus sp. MSK22-1 TaxID=1897630 RepID=UPI000978C2C2|nr:poly(A) polymerase [Motiliproteus sp. MSK22-1]
MGSNSTLGIIIALLPIAIIVLVFYWNLRGHPETSDLPDNTDDTDSNDNGPQMQIISRDRHPVSRKDLSDNALKVLYRLKDAGYEAYLVGGCVRDVMLGKHPKDFDVSTEATPEQVHELFRNSRLIGRRFKLVHVRFGREIIEVATFRASHNSQSNTKPNSKGKDREQQGKQAESGMILRDNVYGNVHEDAIRRDFTVNALYYSIEDFCIHDHANGVADLQNRTLRMIGDPESRYREDPVRMIRAVRFAAKLEFTIEPKTEAPIRQLAPMLADIPAARLFDEVLKLFLSGQAVTTYRLLREFNLFSPLFPATARILDKQAKHPDDNCFAEALIVQALISTDQRIKRGQSVTPAFLFAALLWHPLQERIEKCRQKGLPPIPALHQAAQEIIQEQGRATSIPRRFSTPMREIWDMQYRLPRRFGRRAEQIAEHPRFRAAYDFLLMREGSGEDLDGLGDWWTRYQSADQEQKLELVRTLDKPRSKRRRNRRSAPVTKS